MLVNALASNISFGPSADDVIPKFHLTQLSGGGSKKVVIMGDSTATDTQTLGNAIEQTQTIWGALKTELVRQNPDITFTFVNRYIGGAAWSNPLQTGTATGLSLPSWFATPGNTWLSYIEAEAPDLLFILLGTNFPQAGLAGGSSVTTYIRQIFENINGWAKVPNIILITNKVANPAPGGEWLAQQERWKAMSSFLRTFAKTSAKGYTSFGNIDYVGCIDIGRRYIALTEGYDPHIQYLTIKPSAVVSGVTAFPYTVARSTHGDYYLKFVLKGAAGGSWNTVNGVTSIDIKCSEFLGNRLRLVVGTTGNFAPYYELDGGTSAPAQQGSTKSSSGGGDVTVELTFKAERVIVIIDGTECLNTVGPRLISAYDVIVTLNGTVTGTPTMDVSAFYDGTGVAIPKICSPTEMWGVAPSGGTQGGNGVNHPNSVSNAMFDYAVIEATNLTAP